MSTLVLVTKLFRPTRRSGSVARPRLADRLDGVRDRGHRLTLVSAPAGFGKTTLLGEWTAGHEQTAWLSLDDGDNVAARFLGHLWAALSGIGLDVDTQTVERAVSAPISAMMTALVNELARAGQDRPDDHWLLVLDDYHVIHAAEVHEAVTFLLEHAPDHLHLVVATRSDPPFPLSRLRSRGQLIELRAADLRFTLAEAREFLNEAMGLDLSEDDVRALEERTEGWVAGLQLAALSLRGVSDRAHAVEFIGDFAGSNRFVVDYLVDEVLARQSAEVRDFLLRTSVLDRLTGSLCDAVTGGHDSARALEELDRANVFLVPLDAERCWYRYHHLFGDVLRARLMAEYPEQLPVLNRAAGDWCASHGFVEEAVRHALAAGENHRAAYLMESVLPELRRARRDSVLLGWMQALPDDVVRSSPVLSTVSGWSLLMAGDLDGMERRLDDADAALAAGAHDQSLAATWADTEDLRTAPATVWVYRAALAQARGDVPATVHHARHALDLAGADDHFVRGAAGGFLGLAAWAAGEVDEALSTFSEAVRSLHAAGNLVDELDSTVVLGDMWITAGRPRRARRLYEQALAAATGHGRPHPRATPDLHVGLAELDRELNDLDSAETHLETARILAEHGSITENRHRWYVAMAHLRAATGAHATARQLLDEAEALYRPGFYPDIRSLHALKARIHLMEGDLDAAEEWARHERVTTTEAVTFLREYDHLTLVRLRLSRHRRDARVGAAGAHDPTALDEALALLDRLSEDADPARAGSLLEIGVLRALIHHARGHRCEALAELDRAVARVPEPEGWVRLFLDEGAPMLALLEYAAGHGGELGALREHARRILGATLSAESPAATASAAVRSGDRGALADPLSDRESEVLRLLASELTGPEIARRLFVSLNTLRTHTRRIFTKLDVNTRAAAVRRGRERGLL